MSTAVATNFLNLTLGVYEDECHYLKSLRLDVDNMRAVGEFSVPTTCYAVKGRKYHLNAAEVVITYEQIMYATLSEMFVQGACGFQKIPVDYFFPTVVDERTLIARFNTRFSKPVENDFFTGEFSIKKSTFRGGKYFFKTEFNINHGAQVAEVSLCVDLT